MAKPDVSSPLTQYDIEVETLIVGAGAAGMVAGLRAHEAGQDVLLIEADPLPSGSTALSAGLIPAAGTRFQKQAGITDSALQFAEDIQNKAKFENEQALVDLLAEHSGPTIEWLSDTHNFPFSVITDFDYPGHSQRRMHGLPERSGAELVDALRGRIEELDIPLVCNRRAVELFALDGRIFGVRVASPDGSTETIGVGRLILACNGFGGNRRMVKHHIPQIDGGLWFGHDGNQGEAVQWAELLGAATRHLSAYQGHGNVAHPHGILITWAVISEGGFQVNVHGQRFWDEGQGYSEAARAVLAQPDGVAWVIFDERIAAIARQFLDFKTAEAQGAVLRAKSINELENTCGFPAGNLAQTIDDIPYREADTFGRRFNAPPLSPPYCAVRVTGALFHTQGGIDIEATSLRVRKRDGGLFHNLYAIGGAACGVSGAGDSGYLSGNGLLAATVLGFLVGDI
ncbi:FAD-dependent oxidoreductase [uncultured Sulfitobacter sp.]|uniref:FAD-dependent oxidoreductase n=1 Tax=uncultured Sulfitobacter sp. TaxID=191468 RepID=UPI002611E97F|nr:FAD-dependent oxidoreductase [uncultured Sulfitobacter sp.]